MIYCYFFLLMGLTNPSLGFVDIDYLSYKHSANVIVLT
jgi:hypothetical protein